MPTPPIFTNPPAGDPNAYFNVGYQNSYLITTANGVPIPSISYTIQTSSPSTGGQLPAGVSFQDNGDGTARIYGMPLYIGIVHITLTAMNGTQDVTTTFHIVFQTISPSVQQNPNGLAPIAWGGSRDEDGHRTYWATFNVLSSVLDGPANVLEATGLPVVGSQWNFGQDEDLWAWCLADTDVKTKVSNENNNIWEVKFKFSTKPPNINRCADQTITNPLLIPPEISGDFVKYTEEATYDRFGRYITNSAWEQIRGPKVEFDKNRMSIKIKMPFSQLNLDYVSSFIDTVNTYPIFGFPPRCVKLSKAPWTRKFYGSCYVYYEYTFEFDTSIGDYAPPPPSGSTSSVNIVAYGISTFDRNILDEGTKALNGHWGVGPGSGCTVNVTLSPAGLPVGTPPVATGGSILTATLVTGGTGYQANTTVKLNVTGGAANQTAVLVANTNAAGNVTAVAQLRGGAGYTSTGPLATTTALAYILDNVNGNLPDPTNPSHFNKFKDQHGDPTKVVLNGFGYPADEVIGYPTTPPTIYISIFPSNSPGNAFPPNNMGNPPASSPFAWVVLGAQNGSPWAIGTNYNIGDTVVFIPGTFEGSSVLTSYVAVAATVGISPTDSADWLQMSDDASAYGPWDRLHGYVIGDTVSIQANQTAFNTVAGNLHVEKYQESDFSLLGIPLSF